ncbi:MAG TPA: hypothetical protein VK934_06410 [Fimbriimonas sp.]|nr:hypothetical protein [Fimbriimonas sp.]
MYCRDCARFDLEAEKCLDGKVNPPSWESAVTVSQVLGLRSICVFNDHRERLVRARKPLDRDEHKKLWNV